MDLFAFIPGDEGNQARADAGILDWWAPPGLKAGLFRPAAALTHMLDYALWPDTPLLHHVQSLLWLALALATVALLYRRTMAMPVTAGLANLLFALEDSHTGVAALSSWVFDRDMPGPGLATLPAITKAGGRTILGTGDVPLPDPALRCLSHGSSAHLR